MKPFGFDSVSVLSFFKSLFSVKNQTGKITKYYIIYQYTHTHTTTTFLAAT